MRDYDEVTELLGEKGPYFLKIFVLLCFVSVPGAFISFNILFVGGTPEHQCLVPEVNISEEWRRAIIPLEVVNGEEEPSKCRRYRLDMVRNLSAMGVTPKDVNLTDLEQEACPDGWNYSQEFFDATIVTEWDLVCDDAWKVPTCTSILHCGFLFGSLISGPFSDRFGRKRVFFFCSVTLILSMLIQAFSPSWEVFCVCMFISGSSRLGQSLACFVWATELLSKNLRELYAVFGYSLCFAFGYMALPGIAYGMRKWQTLLLILSAFFLPMISLWWLIPESPRWLVNRGRMQEANAILKHIARKNGVEVSQVIFENEELKEESAPKNKSPMLKHLKNGNVLCITLMAIIVWIATNTGYYGLSLNSAYLSGNLYLNTFISAAIEIPGYMLSLLALKKFPRTPMLSAANMIGGGLLFMIQLVPTSLMSLAITMEMIGKFFFTAAFCSVYMYTAELYPTVIRTASIGLCSSLARLGSILAPYIVFLGTFNRFLPYAILGSFPIVASVTTIFLPETFNKSLPETIEQMQRPKRFCCTKDQNTSDEEEKEKPRAHLCETGLKTKVAG